MRLHPVAAAEIKDDEIVSLINGKDCAPNAHFPAPHGPALFLIFQLRGALSYGLQFFGKQTFLALPAVELLGGPIINLMLATRGRFPGGRWSLHRNDVQPMFIGDTKDRYPRPDGKYIFDKLSSVFITGNATRDDAPNHIRLRKHVPREIAETWQWMCPAGVYEISEDA